VNLTDTKRRYRRESERANSFRRGKSFSMSNLTF
jgi:hypothetical protein